MNLFSIYNRFPTFSAVSANNTIASRDEHFDSGLSLVSMTVSTVPA